MAAPKGLGASVGIVGGGLAGCEAAGHLARAGLVVTIYEQKPEGRSPAHVADTLGELVCSNTFRSDSLDTGPGILKSELRRLRSVVMAAADANRVPGGTALAVDREAFSAALNARIEELPGVSVERREIRSLDEVIGLHDHIIVATGPLTAPALAADLVSRVGSEGLSFYDAIAPIVDAESLDMDKLFFQSRYGKGEPDAYLNSPLDEAQYHAFVAALSEADRLSPREFEDERYFEGCQPIEAIAERGVESLAWGPMKPVGLSPPGIPKGENAYAVAQLRREDTGGHAFNLVGFQTRLPQGEQRRVLRMLPGFESVRFLRYGTIHRNTFLHHPRVADAELRLRVAPTVRLAGQITGVEGYIESTGSGYLAAWALLNELRGETLAPPPHTTALGGLYRHITTDIAGAPHKYQPSNIHFGLIDPLEPAVRKRVKRKRDRRAAVGERAIADFNLWLESQR